MKFYIEGNSYFFNETSPISDLKEGSLSYITRPELLMEMDFDISAFVLHPKGFLVPDLAKVVWIQSNNVEAEFLQIHNTIYENLNYNPSKSHSLSSFPGVHFFSPYKIEGDLCRIDPGAVIGGQGFRIMKTFGGDLERLIHVGSVKIGPKVEIGANSCVDKGTWGVTEIRAHTKIDNLCHVAHNVLIEENVWVAPFVCFGGSSHIKKGAVIGIGAKIRQGITIGENAFIAMGSIVTRDVGDNEEVAGNFAVNKDAWMNHTKNIRE